MHPRTNSISAVKVAPGPYEISAKFRVARKKNRPKLGTTSHFAKFLCEPPVCRLIQQIRWSIFTVEFWPNFFSPPEISLKFGVAPAPP